MSDPFKKLKKKLEANGKECMEKQPTPVADRVEYLKKEIPKQEKWEKDHPWLACLYDMFNQSAKEMRVELESNDTANELRTEKIVNTARCADAYLGTREKSSPNR